LETPNVRDLIRAGFHFGHRTSRWNPAMKPYIFKQRNLIHIIDLRATLRGLLTARRLVGAVAAKGGYVLFVGTKKQASDLVEREGRRCNMPFVAERWPGGLLTNYATVRTRLGRLRELEEMEETGQINLYSKKMVSSLRREKRKILRNLGGVREMDRLPDLLVVVDPARERIAVMEAVKLAIPIIALTDTDGDPAELDVVVPGNDDSIAAIEIFLRTLSEAVLRNLASRPAPAEKAIELETPEAREALGAAPEEEVAPAEADAVETEAAEAEETEAPEGEADDPDESVNEEVAAGAEAEEAEGAPEAEEEPA